MTRTTLRALACALALSVTGTAYAQQADLPAADKAAPPFKVATPDFAKTVMSSDQFEIQSSEMAVKKSDNADVKAFAQKMIDDHEKAEKNLHAALGQEHGKTAAVAPKHAKMLEQLKGASGAEFTTLYLDTQSQAHKEAVALFRTYAGGGDDAKVKAFAKETLPTLEMHADMVQKIVAAQ
ncbi:DUF4142 domain-containing protein [Aureimonas psammosilenae]|uniref:DUF4142 domain-containing protein n=1 Tax=Aureimonas psammosilenae TaxID=2495496 RepID=UPI001260E4D0|nr:DUF4142 domain-containing protein [Aureimonas psammosilenae]